MRAVYIKNREGRGDGITGTQRTQGSNTWLPAPAYFGEGFVLPLLQTRFSLLSEIGETEPLHDPNTVFSPTTTTHAAHVNLGGALNLDHSYSASLVISREQTFFGDDPGTSSSSTSRRLFPSSSSIGLDAHNVFEYMPGVQYGVDEV
jgi:hypothetical protein